MHYLLELVGSSIVGSFVFLMILQLNTMILESNTTMGIEKITQSNMTTLVEEIEYDFRKIGYGATGQKILTADTTSIFYLCDIDLNGNVDTVGYTTSDTTVAVFSPNPKDILLYRFVNGVPITMTNNMGVTDFILLYYTENGTQTNNPADVRYIKFMLSLESQFAYGEEYSASYIERTIQPNNLR
ncbi:hypothetical protein ACFLR4_04410 [Bacteroidota bacterium]